MGAHLRPLATECRSTGCTRTALYEVYTTWNDNLGRYCTRHANELLLRQQAVEERQKSTKWVKEGPSDTKVTF